MQILYIANQIISQDMKLNLHLKIMLFVLSRTLEETFEYAQCAHHIYAKMPVYETTRPIAHAI